MTTFLNEETFEQSKKHSMKSTKQELFDHHTHQTHSFSSLWSTKSSENSLRKKMNEKIWRVLAQILYYRNDLSKTIKPFLENLHHENINDENNIPVLKTFSKCQLEVFYQNGIITNEKFILLISKNQKERRS